MTDYPVLFDIHTHTVASGHGSTDTATDLAKAAASRGLSLLGISDHGPATPGSAKESYFRGLKLAPKNRCGVELLYGIELNILDMDGTVDISDEILRTLDYGIISMHPPTFKSLCYKGNTRAYINAMKHPKVHFIGHPDDGRYPIGTEYLLKAAKEHHVYPEINNGSLMPDAYRKDGYQNSKKILEVCKSLRLPVLLSSDSHGKVHVGDMQYTLPLLYETDFPPELVINSSLEMLHQILSSK